MFEPLQFNCMKSFSNTNVFFVVFIIIIIIIIFRFIAAIAKCHVVAVKGSHHTSS